MLNAAPAANAPIIITFNPPVHALTPIILLLKNPKYGTLKEVVQSPFSTGGFGDAAEGDFDAQGSLKQRFCGCIKTLYGDSFAM